MEQKPIPVKQVNIGPMDDKLDGILALNQNETMKIDTNMARTSETCTTNALSEEVYFHKVFLAKSNQHSETLSNELGSTKSKSDQWVTIISLLRQFFDTS